MMHGDEPEVLDGTQLAADWTFSGLQKFGQGLNDRLRGHKLPNKLLSRVSQAFPFSSIQNTFAAMRQIKHSVTRRIMCGLKVAKNLSKNKH